MGLSGAVFALWSCRCYHARMSSIARAILGTIRAAGYQVDVQLDDGHVVLTTMDEDGRTHTIRAAALEEASLELAKALGYEAWG